MWDTFRRKLHIGDILLQVNAMKITNADMAQMFIASSAKDEVKFKWGKNYLFSLHDVCIN